MDKLTINRWAEEDRPREKMISKGAQALTNAELLAILIGSGNDEDSAVGLMQKVLAAYNNSIDQVGRLSVDELCRFKGIGPAKAKALLAVMPLGKIRTASVEELAAVKGIGRADAQRIYSYFEKRGKKK